METELLVKRSKQGDKDALVELIMQQNREYYKLAYAFLNNKEDALDALADMIVIVYEKIGQLKRDEAFPYWSKTILVNCCKKRLSNRNKIIPYATLEQGSPACEFQQSDDQLFVETGLSRLPPKQQEVIRLRYFLDLDYASIAQILKIPAGTVKSRLATGLKKLKEVLGGKENE